MNTTEPKTELEEEIEKLAKIANNCTQLTRWLETHAEIVNAHPYKFGASPENPNKPHITIYAGGDGKKYARLWPDAKWIRRDDGSARHSITYSAVIDDVHVKIWEAERAYPDHSRPIETPLEL